jgi:hypothetical protein
VNVTYQFQQIPFFLAENGFIAIPKQAAPSMVPPVETHCITGEESAHDGCNRSAAVSQQQVKMVRNQCPCIAMCLCFGDDLGKAINKILSIFVISKYGVSFKAPANNVVKGSGCIYSRSSRHSESLVYGPGFYSKYMLTLEIALSVHH